jgi:hypothetical protein
MQTKHLSTSLFLLSILAFPGCGDAPRSATPESAGAPAPSDAREGLPAGHPAVDSASKPSSGAQVAGRAILKGALAETASGCIFVTLRITGQRIPTWSYRVEMLDPAESKQGLGVAKDGVRELLFVLNEQTTLMQGAIDPLAQYEVQIMYDPDGSVDSKEGQVAAIAPAKLGAEDLYLELDPASAASK